MMYLMEFSFPAIQMSNLLIGCYTPSHSTFQT